MKVLFTIFLLALFPGNIFAQAFAGAKIHYFDVYPRFLSVEEISLQSNALEINNIVLLKKEKDSKTEIGSIKLNTLAENNFLNIKILSAESEKIKLELIFSEKIIEGNYDFVLEFFKDEDLVLEQEIEADVKNELNKTFSGNFPDWVTSTAVVAIAITMIVITFLIIFSMFRRKRRRLIL